CASGLAQLARLDERLAARRRLAQRYREALESIDELVLPCPDRDGEQRGWFVFVVQLPPRCEREEVIRALAAEGIQTKPYLPAIHLLTFYRERFGHRRGEFPVCEHVAARSLALPFFPQMSEAEVARVAQALRALLDAVEQELSEDRFAFDAQDEDIHTAIERRVTEIAGKAGKCLHTARSRNDQVATDVAMYTRECAREALRLLSALMAALL